jgi:signal transduction histidine kinase
MQLWAELREGPAEATDLAWLPGSRSPGRVRTEEMAVVRDEMRVPLLGLEALLDTLAGTPLSQEVTERMQGHSRVLARQVSMLIEDLAVVAAADPGVIAMDFRTIELDQQLAECVASFPDMVVRIEGDRGVQVRGDALRIQQIVSNLVRSVQRHGGRAATIHVSGRGEVVALRVANAGLRDGYELSIVKTLVRAHAGMTILEAGGTITCTLPCASSESQLPVPAP